MSPERRAKAVVGRIKIVDDRGQEHPRGVVVDLGEGRHAFYRDVTLDLWIRTARGWPIEHGVLEHLIWTGVERVHYRVGGARLLTASVADYTAHGVALEANHRSQLVLQDQHWTSYPASQAYGVPSQEHLPWTLVHHQSGEVMGAPRDAEEVSWSTCSKCGCVLVGLPAAEQTSETLCHECEKVSHSFAQGFAQGVRNPDENDSLVLAARHQGWMPVPTTDQLEQQAVDDGALKPVQARLDQKLMNPVDLAIEQTEAAKAIVDLRQLLSGPVEDWTRVDQRAVLQRLAWVASYLMRVDKTNRTEAT
jgi:hypothetical protein